MEPQQEEPQTEAEHVSDTETEPCECLTPPGVAARRDQREADALAYVVPGSVYYYRSRFGVAQQQRPRLGYENYELYRALLRREREREHYDLERRYDVIRRARATGRWEMNVTNLYLQILLQAHRNGTDPI